MDFLPVITDLDRIQVPVDELAARRRRLGG
jgi:hypothetical protein